MKRALLVVGVLLVLAVTASGGKAKRTETAVVTLGITTKDQAARIRLRRQIEDWVLAEDAAGRETKVGEGRVFANRSPNMVQLRIEFGKRTPVDMDKVFRKLRSWVRPHKLAGFNMYWEFKRGAD